jgi:hypothetical protein
MRLLPVTALGALWFSLGPARADLPEVAFGPSFDAVCAELKNASDCEDCSCTARTASFADSTETPYAVLVELKSPDGATPFKYRYAIAAGSSAGLKPAGFIYRREFSGDEAGQCEVEFRKTQSFDDTCLKCDHEGVGPVHIFDLIMKTTRSYQEEDSIQMYDEVVEVGGLVTCFGSPVACYSTPLSMSTVVNEPPMAPGDKGKKGRKKSWSRTWKIGGRDKMEIVLGALQGNAAKDVESFIDEAPRAFNFGDIPTRKSSTRAE